MAWLSDLASSLSSVFVDRGLNSAEVIGGADGTDNCYYLISIIIIDI